MFYELKSSAEKGSIKVTIHTEDITDGIRQEIHNAILAALDKSLSEITGASPYFEDLFSGSSQTEQTTS